MSNRRTVARFGKGSTNKLAPCPSPAAPSADSRPQPVVSQRPRCSGWRTNCLGTGRCPPRTGPGWAWSPMRASRPSSPGTPTKTRCLRSRPTSSAPRRVNSLDRSRSSRPSTSSAPRSMSSNRPCPRSLSRTSESRCAPRCSPIHAKSRSRAPTYTRRPPRPAARGTRDWSRWCSTRCCAPRPTRRCARGCRRWAGTRSRTSW